jgi:diguanylate cyclase (GGDEF)-like protein
LSWPAKVLATSVAFRWLLGGALLACVAALNFATGTEISFSIFYLVPVSFAGAFISRTAGLVLAVASAATWGALEIAFGPGYSAAWIPYWNSVVRLGFFVLVNELIQHLRHAHERQRALAREDSITGIANARAFDEHAHRTIAVSRRSGRPFTIAYVDLDGFKQVNDKYGHSEGDKLLQVIAELLEHGARASDVVARLGGDEFGILMPDTDAKQARASLQRIARTVADGVGDRWPVGATVGAVTFTEPPESVDQAVHEADALMYRGKLDRRGGVLQATWPGRASAPRTVAGAGVP